jgi:hypothetical protein
MTGVGSTFSPPGADKLRVWAAQHGLGFQALPDPTWFQQWEPYDTMIAPSRYVNGLMRSAERGHLVIVEPWAAEDGFEPVTRSIWGFMTHDALRHRASVRIGEWSLTRVAFLDGRPPPQVKLGDSAWDDRAVTLAWTREEALGAFHAGLRRFLHSWNFAGHLELRPGGLVVHVAALRPTCSDIETLLGFLPLVLQNAVGYPSLGPDSTFR